MHRIDNLLFFLLLLGLNSTYAFIDSTNNSIKTNYFNQADNIVAAVDSIQITTAEFYYSYEFGPAFIKRSPESKKHHLDYMINEKLLALYGNSISIDTSEQVIEMYNEIHNDLITRELFKDDVLDDISISEEEIDTVITQKQLTLKIEWLFSENENIIFEYTKLLSEGNNFDTLYNEQFKEGIFKDDRSMKINRYQLGKKNPLLAGIIDTLQIGDVSSPIHTNDGWYLILLESVSRNVFTTETEYNKLYQESINAIKKIKMDEISDIYVRELLLSHNPVISRNAFTILRAYLGKFVLTSEKYNEWDLETGLTNATDKLDELNKSNINNLPLVKLNSGNITLEDFLKWYRNRDQYIKFNKNSLEEYSTSIENVIWRMVRDKLLTGLAMERKLNRRTSVIQESKWWKDKIVYSAVRNELANSIIIENKEVIKGEFNKTEESKTTAQEMEKELSIKIFRLVVSLKQKYKITINENLLNDIQVSAEHDATAIEVYTIKKGGLIPRTPYPTIDRDWGSWE